MAILTCGIFVSIRKKKLWNCEYFHYKHIFKIFCKDQRALEKISTVVRIKKDDAESFSPRRSINVSSRHFSGCIAFL